MMACITKLRYVTPLYALRWNKTGAANEYVATEQSRNGMSPIRPSRLFQPFTF